MSSNLDRHAAAVAADATDERAFAALEEAHFRAAEWDKLVALYRQRLDDPSLFSPSKRCALHHRLGQILEERCLEIDQAIVQYTEAIRIDPGYRPALRQLRQVHSNREAWDLVLQISELESRTLVQPYEKANFFAEMGHVWLRYIQDSDEAMRCFEQALAIDPEQKNALAGLAHSLEAMDRPEAAATAWERLIACTRGLDRAAPLIALAALFQGPLQQTERAIELYRRALSDDPRNENAAEALSASACAAGQWELLSDLLERRFNLASGARRRTAIALEAGHMQLEQLENPEAARIWFERARELSSHDPTVLGSTVELERRAGTQESLLGALQRAIEVAGCDTPLRLLLEAATLLTERADDEYALQCLELAQQKHPDDARVLAALAETYTNLLQYDDLARVLERRASLAEGDPEAAATALVELAGLQTNYLQDADAAQSAYERAFAISPEAAGVAARLESLYRERNSWEPLRDLLEQASEQGPVAERCQFHCALGELLAEHFGAFEASAQSFEASLDLEANPRALQGLSQLAQRSGNRDTLIRALEREVAMPPAPRRRGPLCFQLCELCEAADDFESAYTWAKRAVETAPERRDFLERLASLQERLGLADELCHTLCRLDSVLHGSESSALRRRLANLHEARNEDATALHYWQSALEVEPDDSTSLRALRRRYRELGRPEDLAPILQKLSALCCGDERAGFLDELCSLLDERLGDLDAAIVAAEQLRNTPGRPEHVETRLQSLLERAGRFEDLSQLLFERAEQADDIDDQEHLKFERAVLLEELLGDVDQARHEYTHLCRSTANPGMESRAGSRLEHLLERCGDWEALRTRLETAIESAPPQQRLALHMRIAGLSHDRLGDPEGSAQHLEAAGRLDPQRPDTWRRLGMLYQQLERPEDLLRVTQAEIETSPDPERERVLRARAAELWMEQAAGQERACQHYERLLEIEPGRSDASEFLIAHYTQKGLYDQVAGLLEDRLAAVSRLEASGDGVSNPNRVQSLCLRIAELRAEQLGDPCGAIEALETAYSNAGPVGAATEPLAELYQQTHRQRELIELCERAATACSSAEERARWLLRLAACLQQEGDDAGAAAAYREVLDERPEEAEAFACLCTLYRQSDTPGVLADLLDSALSRSSGVETIALRMELAQLLEAELDRPADALHQLQQVLQLEPDHDPAFQHALDLSARLERHAEQMRLIDARLELDGPANERADLLERSAVLLSGPLGSADAALRNLRAAIALDPDRPRARTLLRETLEQLGRWNAVLDCLGTDAESAEPQERRQIYERAAEVAHAHLGPDAALPWLERLRAGLPEQAQIVGRIAEVHRSGGRYASVLRALEDQLTLTTDLDGKRDLHLDRARVLEHERQDPVAAIAALQAARQLAPNDAETLRKLDELYDRTGCAKQRAEVIEARIQLEAIAPRPLHLAAADLYSEVLANPAAAIPHLLEAASLTRPAQASAGEEARASSEANEALVAKLASSLRAAGLHETPTGSAEIELERLLADLPDGPSQNPGSPESLRRAAIHWDLSWLYAESLANPTAGFHHMQRVLELAGDGCKDAGFSPEERNRLECALLERLRQDGNGVELEQRLAARLEGGAGDASDWLELARLRDEKLHLPRAALEAYCESLRLRPSCLAAIRGLRDLAERLADWPQLARCLELELALPEPEPRQQALLKRRLGDVCWRQLQDLDRATQAYRAALEDDPRDLQSVRSLQELSERTESWDETAALYEREVEILAEAEPERRKALWLQAAKLETHRKLDPARALRAFEAAARVSRLRPEDTRVQAQLYQQTGATEKFAATYASWCDDPAVDARSADHLALVPTLVELGQQSQALLRARKAIDVEAGDPEAWATLAQLHQAAGCPSDAGDAWERAGELQATPAAAALLTQAGLLVESRDRERARRRLRRAVELDPASGNARAHLARIALELEDWAEAETAAARALDLAAADSDNLPDVDLQLETALVGARAARKRERLEAALLFLGAALDLDSSHAEALEAYGELHFERGDLVAARSALEARLAAGPDKRRAEHLTLLASVLELQGDAARALERFREAVADDPSNSAGHAGMARLCEQAGRADEAIDALEQGATTAQQTGNAAGCAERLLRAAEIEIAHARPEAAEAHLRQALDATPESPRAWVLLAEILDDEDRIDELLCLAPEALSTGSVSATADAVSRLSLLHARALEQRSDPASAIDAYAAAVHNDPRCAEAALAQARLLRAQGAWSAAADTLRSFCDEHPEPDRRDLGEAHYKLAQLLAGPLEDIEGAIHSFERVLEIAPDHPKAREPLATLLTVTPGRWREAIVQHAALLQTEPTRSASFRSLHQLAKSRNQDELSLFGLVVLRAIGAASPGERSGAADFLPRPIVSTPALEKPTDEIARQVIYHAREALDEVLGTSLEANTDGLARVGFPGRMLEAEGTIAASGLDHFSDTELPELLHVIAVLSSGDDAEAPAPESHLDAALVASLATALGRRARRKIRRALEGVPLDQLRALDAGAWRLALRGLAAAVAVDDGQGDLRNALVALAQQGEPPSGTAENDDWTARIEGKPIANELLRQVAASWCRELTQI